MAFGKSICRWFFLASFTLIALSTCGRHEISWEQVSKSSQHLQLKIHKCWNVTFNNSLIALCQPLQLFADHPKVSWFRDHFISKGQWVIEVDHSRVMWLYCLLLFFYAPCTCSCLLFQASVHSDAACSCSLCCIQVTACELLMKELGIRLNLVVFWLLIKITAFVPWRYF